MENKMILFAPKTIHYYLVNASIVNGNQAIQDIKENDAVLKYSGKIKSLSKSDVQDGLNDDEKNRQFIIKNSRENNGLRHTYFKLHDGDKYTVLSNRQLKNFKSRHHVNGNLSMFI